MELVIKVVEKMTNKQRILTPKLTGRHKSRITLTWTLGVIYEDENYSNKENKKYIEENNDYNIKYNNIIE